MDEAEEFEEADALILLFQSVFGVEGLAENAAARGGALHLPLLHIAGDLAKLFLDRAKIPLQLLEQRDGRGKLLADPRRLVAIDEAVALDLRDLLGDAVLLGPQPLEMDGRIVRGADHQAVQCFDDQLEPRFGADEALLGGDRLVEKGQHLLGVRRKFVDRLVPLDAESPHQPPPLADAPFGEIRLGAVAEHLGIDLAGFFDIGGERRQQIAVRHDDQFRGLELPVAENRPHRGPVARSSLIAGEVSKYTKSALKIHALYYTRRQ